MALFSGWVRLTLLAILLLFTAHPTQSFPDEKLTHLHFYLHDILSGAHPTAVPVANVPSSFNTSTLFGLVTVIDDALTQGPDLGSRPIGRAQGIYTGTSLSEISFLWTINFVFTNGEFNGSTLTTMGRDPINLEVRELPILGGTGAFRFARGYLEVRTSSLDFATGNAVLGIDAYVRHY